MNKISLMLSIQDITNKTPNLDMTNSTRENTCWILLVCNTRSWNEHTGTMKPQTFTHTQKMFFKILANFMSDLYLDKYHAMTCGNRNWCNKFLVKLPQFLAVETTALIWKLQKFHFTEVSGFTMTFTGRPTCTLTRNHVLCYFKHIHVHCKTKQFHICLNTKAQHWTQKFGVQR